MFDIRLNKITAIKIKSVNSESPNFNESGVCSTLSPLMWVSMGGETEVETRMKTFAGFRINDQSPKLRWAVLTMEG